MQRMTDLQGILRLAPEGLAQDDNLGGPPVCHRHTADEVGAAEERVRSEDARTEYACRGPCPRRAGISGADTGLVDLFTII
mgnify:CR=1 FL=1